MTTDMKKIFSFLCAGLVGLMAASCVQEPMATFDPTDATAPVLGTTDIGEKAISVTYTPGSFGMGFNEKIAPNHALAIVSVNGNPASKIVSTTDDGSSLKATCLNISKTLTAFGYKDGDLVPTLQLAVRATMQSLSQDNGVNGFVDSQDKVTLNDFLVSIPVGSPYADYTEATTWSVIGKLSNYEIDWNGDIEMFATKDGNHLVAKAVKIAAGDEFKFRKDQDWAVNMGGEFTALDATIAVTQDGANIKVGVDGIYDLWLDLETNTASVTDAYLAYPNCKDASTWSVIGKLTNYNIDWNGDIAMITDGTTHVAQGVKIAAGDEFKFRKDADWAVNMGGEFGGIGNSFAVTQDGANIKIGTDGIYDLILDPSGTATIVETLGGGISNKIAVPESEPQADSWGLIGIGGDWEKDIVMTETDGVWSVVAQIAATDGWKIRKNASWDENYGGPGEDEPYVLTLDTPLTGVSGGKNLAVPEDGYYQVSFNATTFEITVSKSGLWSVIGAFNGWAADEYMTQIAPGIWISEELELTDGGWKIRFANNWDINRGGATPGKDGEFVAAYPGGDDIKFATKARVVFNENNQTIGTLGWGVVGKVAAIPGFDWNNDLPMNLAADGNWYSVPVTLADGDKIKLRWKGGWDDNRGGDAAAADEAFAVSNGGNDISAPAAGTYMVVYNPTEEKITLSTDFWSLIGEFNEWGGDRFLLPLGEGKWGAYNQEIDGKWKVRKTADWTTSAGGTYAAAGTAFDAVTKDGPDIIVTDMTRFDVLYDTVEGKITVNAPVK